MKAIHPDYSQIEITCACGNKFTTGSTMKSLHVEVCSACHPFFTGAQKFLDTLGKVDRFIAKRQAASGYTPKNSKKNQSVSSTPKTLKEMLTVNKTDK